MKIGIVTFWWSQDNYGQLLQCYATQKYLQQLGHDAFLIKVRNFAEEPTTDALPSIPVWRKMLSLEHWRFLFRSLYGRVYNIYINKYVQNHCIDRHFDDFRREHIVSTERVYSHDELVQDPPEVDVLVTGSDMVWGVGLHHHEYFLDFGADNIRRIAIAPSFGRTWESLTDGEKQVCKRYLSRYDGITVREEAGLRICHNLGFKQAVRICDPTMLLDTTVYDELIGDVPIPDCRDRAFVYYIGYDQSYLSDKQIIKVLRHQRQDYHYASAGAVNSIPKVFPSIPQWLRFIRDSRFVVTNSFHGVLFCLMFRKQFAVVPLRIEERNTRVETILREVGLEDRICRTNEQLYEVMEQRIDYSKVALLSDSYSTRSSIIIKTMLK